MATQSQGTCHFCDSDYAKGGMVRHLRACSEREAAIEAADGASETMYHLRAEDEWGRPFWLDLEMRGSASLEELDRYLRAIWLECCGHLSQFSVGGWGGSEIPKSRRVDQVFDEDTELTHIYDFGTESRTLIRTMDVREGPPTTEHPIELMARNNKPEAICMECDREASWLCVECMYDEDASGTLCEEHVEEHPHDAYGHVRLHGPRRAAVLSRTLSSPAVCLSMGTNRSGVTPEGRAWTDRQRRDASSVRPRHGRLGTLWASPRQVHLRSSGRARPHRGCGRGDVVDPP